MMDIEVFAKAECPVCLRDEHQAFVKRHGVFLCIACADLFDAKKVLIDPPPASE